MKHKDELHEEEFTTELNDLGRMNRRTFVKMAGMTAGALALGNLGLIHPAYGSAQVTQTALPGRAIPQFVEALPHFAGNRVTGDNLSVEMMNHLAQVLPAPNPALGIAGFPQTAVWAYKLSNGTNVFGPNYPGFTVVATRNTPTQIKYINNLGLTAIPGGGTDTLYKLLTVDQSLHWANPLGNPMMVGNPPVGNPANYNGPVPAVAHLHGAEVPPQIDGGPDAWFTSDGAYKGHAYYTKPGAGALANEAIYNYPNSQEATTLWFHDHALGVTRLNVYAGLAAFYFLRDPLTMDTGVAAPGGLPADPYEIEIVIQDRQFDTLGQWIFPDGSPPGAPIGLNGPPPNPTEHPYWNPEFIGDAIVVNGKTWPYLDVEPRRYRFRFLNGSNARFYEMFLINTVTDVMGPTIWQIGTDGGLLDAPVPIDPNAPTGLAKLVLGPGERADVIIDFANLNGQTLLLRNVAKTPYPGGGAPDGRTTGRIMQFRVVLPINGIDDSYNPDPAAGGGGALRTPMVRLPGAGPNVQKIRQLTLNEIMGAGGPLAVVLNNTRYLGTNRPDFTPVTVGGVTAYYSELPKEGDTEVWEIVNITADAHPIHLHLVQFQLISRQNIDVKRYNAAYAAVFPGGGIDPMTGQPFPPGVFMPEYGPPLDYNTGNLRALGGNPDITPYLKDGANPPAPNEAGWKDTVIMFPGQVTRIAVRYAPTDQAIQDPNGAGNTLFYPFVPNGGHGYVWHCHILDHEDNEMMRPKLVQPKNVTRTYTDY